ncbi:DUF1513 domain-containing protein [Litorivita sp. NS0012-18]|uniref:DUF1513 domain-containing protein n=1 Tax=Litorivita sp. NS0012-18 TaxID=3127655 RepID=UPI0031084B08
MDKTTRRSFLTGLAASTLTPAPSWADAGSPAFLSAARLAQDRYALCGMDARGRLLFQLPLPARGHAAAAHPQRPEVVGFARRPGNFAYVIDCARGAVSAELTAPEGYHFYGHGVFSQDARRLFTTENDFETARGMIGVWDVRAGYRRIGTFESGGIGPHEIIRLPQTDTLVVANGGIETHPDAGRAKLNLATMAPNLAYISEAGRMLEQVSLPQGLHQNSIRHIDVAASGPLAGTVAIGLQWQGDMAQVPPVVALHRRGGALRLLDAGAQVHRDAQGYIGSIAFDHDGRSFAATCPRAGFVLLFDAITGAPRSKIAAPDACGVTRGADGLMVTCGTGGVRFLSSRTGRSHSLAQHNLSFDNHLVRL